VAKTRAQRKAEARRRAQQQAQRPEGAPAPTETEVEAQHQTQVPESADAIEAELAERGADLDALRGDGAATEAPAPSRADVGRPADAEPEPVDKISRRARRREERDAKERAKESERRRAPKELKAPVERQRGGIMGFFASCVAELRRVQWPDRETLIQATAITVIFIAALAAYLGILDAIFNWLVQRIL
jgi:preprotein translocase SecE subunit